MKKLSIFITFGFISIVLAGTSMVPEKDKNITYEDKDIRMRFVQFTPQQIGAFYEGREFNKAAIKKLMAVCFVTIILKNKTDDTLWLELDHWNFNNDGKSFNRLTRAYWQEQWDEIDLKQAHRSTFSWTLMPATRDLYSGEAVGGRIPIPMQNEPFSLTLNFSTGDDKKGKVKSVNIDNITCKQEDS